MSEMFSGRKERKKERKKGVSKLVGLVYIIDRTEIPPKYTNSSISCLLACLLTPYTFNLEGNQSKGSSVYV